VFLHELGQDLVLALEFAFEAFDLLLLGIFKGLGLATVLEGEVGVLEELALPLVKEGGVDVELVAQVGDGGALKEMSLDDSDFLLGSEMASASFVGHGSTSVQVMLTRTKATSRFD
jgi:hypothetical protein